MYKVILLMVNMTDGKQQTVDTVKKSLKLSERVLKKRAGIVPVASNGRGTFMCKEFKEQAADPEFEVFCHYLLYFKAKG